MFIFAFPNSMALNIIYYKVKQTNGKCVLSVLTSYFVNTYQRTIGKILDYEKDIFIIVCYV